jgi:predicted SpoU family rRNA methylase|tara:strand:- start:102 stop:620 length:519 start_codon:yes stop_codon:yes gene_type:complete
MITYNKAISAVIVVTLINGFFSTNMFKKYDGMYRNQITELRVINDSLKERLSEYEEYGIIVDVTMYQPVYPQTDKTPDITADGTRIRVHKASEYKFVALSRNLLKRWGGPFDYGDFVLLKNAGHKDGVYQVRDTMNPKWVNVVDILESKDVRPYKFTNAHIFKLPWVDTERG